MFGKMSSSWRVHDSWQKGQNAYPKQVVSAK